MTMLSTTRMPAGGGTVHPDQRSDRQRRSAKDPDRRRILAPQQAGRVIAIVAGQDRDVTVGRPVVTNRSLPCIKDKLLSWPMPPARRSPRQLLAGARPPDGGTPHQHPTTRGVRVGLGM